MTVKLSNTEVQQLRQILAEYDKSVRSWQKVRWLIVVMALILSASSIYTLFSLQALQDQFSYSAYGLKESAVTDFLEGHVEMLATMAERQFFAAFSGVLGLWLFVGTVFGWRGRHSEIVLAKCLRAILKSNSERNCDT